MILVMGVPAMAESDKSATVGFEVAGQTTVKSESEKELKMVAFEGWGFGFTSALATPGDVSVNMGRSFNFMVSDLVAFRHKLWKKGTLSYGMGIELRNYRMTGERFFVEDSETKKISVMDWGDGVSSHSSKLHSLYTTYNIKYIQNLGKGFRLAVGPELIVARSVNRRRTLTNKAVIGGEEYKEKVKDVRFNKVGFNVVAMATYKNHIGIYTKYSPSSVLDPSFGPEFNTLTVGVVVGGI